MDISALIQTVALYADSPETASLLETAYEIAADAHRGFTRISGGPFINHPLAVAAILAEWHAPAPIVAVGLLHDILSSPYTYRHELNDLQVVLRPEVFRLLHTMIELNKYVRHVEEGDYYTEAEASDFRYRMATFLKKEPGAVVIKIADRLHNLRTVSFLTDYYQERTVGVGKHLFGPLTERLSMGIARREIEDNYFKVTNSRYYETFQQYCSHPNVQQHIGNILEELEQIVRRAGIACEIRWQQDSFDAMGQNVKTSKSMHVGMVPTNIADIGAFILLTEGEDDCYRLLGTIHKLYSPLEGQFRDNIGNPKENGYRSLDTHVKHLSGGILHLYIRTRAMHLVADYGITASWWDVSQENLPSLPEEKHAIGKNLRVFTPKGEEKDLLRGATALDFAYSIHTDIGHHCARILVNGTPAELYRPLQDRDRVEVIADELHIQPELRWLEYAKTPQAISRIRQWLGQNRRDEMLAYGQELLDRELLHFGLSTEDAAIRQLLAKVVSKGKYHSIDDLLVGIAVGRYDVTVLVERMKSMRLNSLRSTGYTKPEQDVSVLSPDAAHLDKDFAQCCQPVPPDDIVGYRRKNDVLAIHKSACPQIKEKLNSASRQFVQVKWSSTISTEPMYIIVVKTHNRPGLASDVSTIVTLQGLDMQSFTAVKMPDGITAEVRIQLGKTTLAQRNRILTLLSEQDYVHDVEIVLSSFLADPVSLPVLPASSYDPNPYGPTLASGSRFYGREDECERISNLLRDRKHNHAILLCGQKRIGKTSLVLRLQHMAQDDFYPVYIDVQGLRESSTTQFLYHFMSSIAEMLQNKLPDVRQEISVPNFNKLRKEPLSYYDAFMNRIEKVALRSPLVVLLDEFQCLWSLREEGVSPAAIFSRLRSSSLHGKDMHIVLSGSGLPNQLFDQYNIASLFSITHDERLACLKEEAAHKLIKDGLGKVGNISDQAIGYLFELTAGHPFYLQLLCSKLHEQAQEQKTQITLIFAREVVQNWIAEAGKHRFQHFWEGYDAKSALVNKLVLSAIAQLSVNQYGAAHERIAAIVYPTIAEKSLVQSLGDLTEMGILKQFHSQYVIEVPLFVTWLQHHCPFELVLEEARWL